MTVIVSAIFATLALTQTAFAADGVLTGSSELLEAEAAFQVSATMKDAKTVALTYRIADGYYMYRGRFKFAVESGAVSLKKVVTPAGKLKHDATFGRVETYRGQVRVLLFFTTKAAINNFAAPANGTIVEPIKIKIVSQGCADAGVCYPPLVHHFSINPATKGSIGPDSPTNPVAPTSSIVKPTNSVTDLIRKIP